MSGISHRSRPVDIVRSIWAALRLPPEAVSALSLDDIPRPFVPSSYKITELAQSSIALSALAASLVQSQRLDATPKAVNVDPLHAAIEFSSEKYNYIEGEGPPPLWGPLSGLYECADGYVRLHDSFANHREAIQRVFGVKERPELEKVLTRWKKEDVERVAEREAFAAYALRSEEEWGKLEQATMSGQYPVDVVKRSDCPARASPAFATASSEQVAKRPLRGLRVLELSRVLAAPVAGRTLAHHGADVIWVTSPNLPSLPGSDRDVSRGKRTVQLDLTTQEGREKLRELVKGADVFIQSYRPGSLEKRGFGSAELRKLNPGLIYANLSAWGPGPWAHKRGFDSLVQTATGVNASEAQAFSSGAARALPCQALDHSGGYYLASGILAALWHRGREGGGWDVNVSLQGCMQLLKDLGRTEEGVTSPMFDQAEVDMVSEEQMSGLGMMKAVGHAGVLEGCKGGFDFMPKTLGSDKPEWL